MYKKDTVLFAGGYGVHDEEAREYCRRYGFTPEDVKMVRRGDSICVVAITEVDFEGR